MEGKPSSKVIEMAKTVVTIAVVSLVVVMIYDWAKSKREESKMLKTSAPVTPMVTPTATVGTDAPVV